ncbi:hypothetical protein V2J09_021027 [Rumex salicifolius]
MTYGNLERLGLPTRMGSMLPLCDYRPRCYERTIAWSNLVVLKVLGHPVSHPVMERRVRQMWNIKGRMTLIDMPNHYFVARPESDIIHMTYAWVWLLQLSMVLYEEQVLYGIATAIGNPICNDLNTLTAARGFCKSLY